MAKRHPSAVAENGGWISSPGLPEPTVSHRLVAAGPEPRDFSIELPAEPVIPPEATLPGQPFVPRSSFSYLFTARDNPFQSFSREQIGQAIQVLSAIDWKKIEKQLSENGQLDAQKLLRIKKQTQQKLLELLRVYRNSQPEKTPEKGELQGKEGDRGKGGSQFIIVYI